VKKVIKIIACLLILADFILPVKGQSSIMAFTKSVTSGNKIESINEELVDKFYKINQQKLFWFSPGEQSLLLRQELKNVLDSSRNLGLNKEDYHYEKILEYITSSFLPNQSLEATDVDRIFTDAAIKFCENLYCGKDIASWISADQISLKYAEMDMDHIVNRLIECNSARSLSDFIMALEPNEKEYLFLKSCLKQKLQTPDSATIKSLVSSLNQLRWMSHFALKKYIVVNIPSATLEYYESDTVKLKMKVVVGKPSTRTPRIATYCNQVILYPYWNVPRKIAVNELLPQFKKNPQSVESMNMQIIDGHGRILDPDSLKWSLYNKNNFPYQVRQSTGCDNALGVIKFNLTSPYDVYMHDTNFKIAFKSDRRFFSHGCIRLEKPLELANYLLDDPIDSSFIASCLKDQSPKNIQLNNPIPVFVVYISTEQDSAGNLRVNRDVYGLLKQRL
jgi:murein L,D-transpeptidase YcbB/YkuD